MLAVALGIAVGTVIGLAHRLRAASHPVTEFLRSIPPPLMLPFVLVVIGIGDDSKIVLIVLGAVWPVLLNTMDGIAGVDPTLLDTARVYQLGARDRIVRLMLPAAAPQIFAGLRTSLSLSLTTRPTPGGRQPRPRPRARTQIVVYLPPTQHLWTRPRRHRPTNPRPPTRMTHPSRSG